MFDLEIDFTMFYMPLANRQRRGRRRRQAAESLENDGGKQKQFGRIAFSSEICIKQY